MNNTLLEGKPGVGKTTLILKIAALLSGHRIGGFFTKEIREQGQRVGFRVDTFSGRSSILAHVNFTAGPTVGKYHVALDQFEDIALDELENALMKSSVILIDEIGKMELFSRSFQKILHRCFDSDLNLIASVMSRPFPFVDDIKRRPDVRLISVTFENRNILAEKIASSVKNMNTF